MTMATCCYSVIDVCGFQVNRLDCDGNILNGPTDVVLSCAIVDISWTPIKGEERSTSDPNGRGGNCATRKKPASIENYEVKITLCSKTDPALMEVLDIYDVVQSAEGECLGTQPKDLSEDCDCVPTAGCTDAGVSIVVWHVPWLDDEPHPDYPAAITAFPKVKFDRGSITVTRNTDFNTYTLTGTSYKNPNWGQGPGSVYPNPGGLTVDWAEFMSPVLWPGGCTCDLCGYAEVGVDTAIGGVEEGKEGERLVGAGA